MKHFIVALVAFVTAIGATAYAGKKHASPVSAPYPGVAVSGQPGQVPLIVNMPNALTPNTQFVWDGGPGSAPPVQIFPVLAPSYHFLVGGEAISLVGLDGGGVPGVELEERGQIISATMPTFTVLNHIFTAPPNCMCTWALGNGTSVIKTCQAQEDAGVGGPAGDGGPVTTVVIATSDADGGTLNYDCIGY